MSATAIGAAISGVASLGGTVAGLIEGKKEQDMLDATQRFNKQWYDMKNREDVINNRADLQNVLNKQRDILLEQSKFFKATNKVTGGSNEQLGTQLKAANESMGGTIADVAGQTQAYKDANERAYLQQKAALDQQQLAHQGQKLQNIAAAASQGVSAGLNLIGADIQAPSIKKVNDQEGNVIE